MLRILSTLLLTCLVAVLASAAGASRMDDYEAWRASQDSEPSAPMPEPGSALVFATGLLVASQVARRRRSS